MVGNGLCSSLQPMGSGLRSSLLASPDNNNSYFTHVRARVMILQNNVALLAPNCSRTISPTMIYVGKVGVLTLGLICESDQRLIRPRGPMVGNA